jgi:cytochrome c oxidase cbb3-type subunit 2
VYAPVSLPAALRLKLIAHIIKFGLPGTDMPGHEYLPDEEVAALAGEVVTLGESKAVAAVSSR